MGSSDNASASTAKLEEFAILQLELDRKTGSLTGLQLFTLAVSFVILVVFLGLVAELVVGGSPFGIIFAASLASLALSGASGAIRANNVRKFVEQQREKREAEDSD